MSFNGEVFSELIKSKGLTTLEIINILKNSYDIDMTIDTMKSYRRKNNPRTPSLDKLIAFSEILGTSIDVISGKSNEKPVKFFISLLRSPANKKP